MQRGKYSRVRDVLRLAKGIRNIIKCNAGASVAREVASHKPAQYDSLEYYDIGIDNESVAAIVFGEFPGYIDVNQRNRVRAFLESSAVVTRRDYSTEEEAAHRQKQLKADEDNSLYDGTMPVVLRRLKDHFDLPGRPTISNITNKLSERSAP